MSISVFTESYSASMGNHRRQVLLVPMDNEILVYTRKTDGLKGPQNKWEQSDLDTVIADIDSTEVLTAEPVGVYVSPTDEDAIRDKGYSPVLGTKATAAYSKSSAAKDSDPVAVICYMYSLIAESSSELHNLVIDARRTSTVLPVPNVALPTQTTAAPVAAAEVKELQLTHFNLASVPHKDLADRYINRVALGGVEDFKIFDDARANHKNVLIYGPTGPGKTTAVTAWAAARNLRMATIPGNAALEPGHLFGKLISDGTNNFVWIDGPVTDVVRNGGVLCLDEFNFISPKIYTVIYPLTDSRRTITLLDHKGEVIEAHPDLTIFATMNPEYTGTTALNKAMRNRFSIQIPWDYDTKVEAKLVSSKNLMAVAGQLREEAAKGQYETPISTNMLMEFCEFVPRLGYEFAVDNFIAHFDEHEQPSVRLVFQTHEHNIKPDFGIDVNILNTEAEEAKQADEAIQIVVPNTVPGSAPITVTI